MRHYLGARLHRKLFMAMGLAIFATIVSCVAIVHLMTDSQVHEEGIKNLENFFSARFAEVWDDSEKRTAIAEDAAQAFRVGITLTSAQGLMLGQYGTNCHDDFSFSFPVKREATRLGRVSVCPGEHVHFEKRALLTVLATAGIILWIFAGLMARKLGRPLLRLAEVTQEIGEGKLSSRVRLGRGHDGEIGLLANSINDMAERLERQMKGQRELLAGVSHEIRTPLTRLRVLTEILRDQNVSEKSLANIEQEIDDINDLTGQLLASSRLEFENIDQLELDPIELAKTSLARTNVNSSVLVTSGAPHVIKGDATLIGRALINLIENAKHHGQGLSELHVDFDERRVQFTARDEGPGFRPEDLPRAFESFYRGTGSGKGSSSLGLGLALVRRIAQAHGGDAHAQNRPTPGVDAAGAEVSFTIPLSFRAFQ